MIERNGGRLPTDAIRLFEREYLRYQKVEMLHDHLATQLTDQQASPMFHPLR